MFCKIQDPKIPGQRHGVEDRVADKEDSMVNKVDSMVDSISSLEDSVANLVSGADSVSSMDTKTRNNSSQMWSNYSQTRS